MAKKKTDNAEKHEHGYDIQIVWDARYSNWFGIYTWYVDGEAYVSITAAGISATICFNSLMQGMSSVQISDGWTQLQLPDQGDWQIRYHRNEE